MKTTTLMISFVIFSIHAHANEGSQSKQYAEAMAAQCEKSMLPMVSQFKGRPSESLITHDYISRYCGCTKTELEKYVTDEMVISQNIHEIQKIIKKSSVTCGLAQFKDSYIAQCTSMFSPIYDEINSKITLNEMCSCINQRVQLITESDFEMVHRETMYDYKKFAESKGAHSDFGKNSLMSTFKKCISNTK